MPSPTHHLPLLLLPLALALSGCEDAALRARLAALDGWFEAAARPGGLLAALRDLEVAGALGRRGRVTRSGQAWLVTIEHLGVALARQRQER